MKTVSGEKFAKILEKHGWQLLRTHGSHHIYGKPGRVERISVPVHGSQPLKVGMLAHFLKITGLTEKDL
jgi:predicted RNA binding protein YcfA (HicA-like mRNA interferase family)